MIICSNKSCGNWRDPEDMIDGLCKSCDFKRVIIVMERLSTRFSMNNLAIANVASEIQRLMKEQLEGVEE